MTAGALEPEAIEFAPLPAEADFDTAFDADHKTHAQLLEKHKQRLVCKSAIGREPDATRFDVLKDQFERPFDHGALIQMHPTFEHILVVSAPVNRDGASTDDQRDDEQVLLIFSRPVDSQADFTERRDLAERLMSDAFGQPFRREPLIVNQSREPFAGRFLVALRACQFRLAVGLFVKNRRDEGRQGVELMPMCPGQCRFDIVYPFGNRSLTQPFTPHRTYRPLSDHSVSAIARDCRACSRYSLHRYSIYFLGGIRWWILFRLNCSNYKLVLKPGAPTANTSGKRSLMNSEARRCKCSGLTRLRLFIGS